MSDSTLPISSPKTGVFSFTFLRPCGVTTKGASITLGFQAQPIRSRVFSTPQRFKQPKASWTYHIPIPPMGQMPLKTFTPEDPVSSQTRNSLTVFAHFLNCLALKRSHKAFQQHDYANVTTSHPKLCQSKFHRKPLSKQAQTATYDFP